MFRSLGMVVLEVIVLVLALGGCKSPSSMLKVPFSSAPDPHISSPAEMEELQLKSPPESYTKGTLPPKKQVKEENSYAQQGEYTAPRSSERYDEKRDFSEEEIASSAVSGVDSNGQSGLPGFHSPMEESSSTPVQMAMNPSAIQSNIPSDSQNGYYGAGESSLNSPSTSFPQTSTPQIFAPGSIGGY